MNEPENQASLPSILSSSLMKEEDHEVDVAGEGLMEAGDQSHRNNDVNDGEYDGARIEEWNLLWYECFFAFHSKNHDPTKAMSQLTSVFEEDIMVPAAVLKQLEIAKQQMTEYHTMIELLEKTTVTNDKLQEEVFQCETAEEALREKLGSRVAKQQAKLKKMSRQYARAKKEIEKLASELNDCKAKEKSHKEGLERDLAELRLLRQFRLYEEKCRSDFGQDIRRRSASIALSAKSPADENANTQNRVNSSSQKSSKKKNGNVLKSLVKHLRDEEDEDKVTEIKPMKRASNRNSRTTRTGSLSSQSTMGSFSSLYSRKQSDASLFKIVLTTLYDEGDNYDSDSS